MAIAPLSYSAGWLRGIGEAREQMFDLQRQMTTGKKADLYSGLVNGIDTAVTMRANLAKLESRESSVSLIAARMDMMDVTLERFNELARETRTLAASTSPLADLPSPATLKTQARAQLDETISLLNTDVGGRYLFAGRATTQEPVVGVKAMLDGDNSGSTPKAGFKQVSAERLAADLGPDSMGRLDTGIAGSVVTVGQELENDKPFGFKIDAVAATPPDRIAVAALAGPPPSSEITFGDPVPEPGDTVTVSLSLPDGSKQSVSLKAVATAKEAEEPGTFLIVSDQATPAENSDQTAANFKASLDAEIGRVAKSELAAVSSFEAAKDFFDTDPPRRVNATGDDFRAPADYVDDTVVWYRGANSSDPRTSSVAEVADKLTVTYGAQANEDRLKESLKSLAIMAVSDYELPGKEGEALYSAKTSKIVTSLKDGANGINEVRAEIATQRITVDKAAERNKLETATSEELLASVENSDINEVAVMLLQLQTQLQGSYQVTSMLSKLSLVNML